MSTSNKLKAFVRFDGSGRVVPSSVILARFKPKVGNYHEIDAYECCNEAPTTTTTTTQGGVTPTAWVANISTTGGLWNACNNPNVVTVVYTITNNAPFPPNTPIYADAACTILAYGCCFVTISINGYVYELINGYTNPLGGYGQPCAEITTTTTTTIVPFSGTIKSGNSGANACSGSPAFGTFSVTGNGATFCSSTQLISSNFSFQPIGEVDYISFEGQYYSVLTNGTNTVTVISACATCI